MRDSFEHEKTAQIVSFGSWEVQSGSLLPVFISRLIVNFVTLNVCLKICWGFQWCKLVNALGNTYFYWLCILPHIPEMFLVLGEEKKFSDFLCLIGRYLLQKKWSS